MGPSNAVFPAFAFIGFILSLVPLNFQLEAWNVGAVWYIFWTALSCMVQYFSSIVWENSTENSAPAWCDISIRIMMGASVGIPAAALCINRRLYYIASALPATVVSKQETRRAIIIDSFICGLFPVLYTGLQIVVQRHRYDILEDVGCVAALYNSPPTYFISSAWPLIISLNSAVYLSLSQWAFVGARATLGERLSAHKNLTPMRFMRLSGLAFVVLCLTVPLGLLTIATNATAVRISTEVSGDVAPFDFSLIAQIPRDIWAADYTNHLTVELTRWLGTICALVFFGFFGVAEEARANYARAYTIVSIAFWNTLARIGYTRPLPPLPSAPMTDAASIQLCTLRTYNISLPIRPASGTGSFADFNTPSSQHLSSADSVRKAQFGNPMTRSVAASELDTNELPMSYAPARPSSVLEGDWVPTKHGLYFRATTDTPEGTLIQAQGPPRVIERALPPTPKEPSAVPRGRKLI
ncbi:pheromone A receptor-domain-containing protein [Mycena belliarum]|uniref:Pheromone A receptor-domain-containing protein n=1 Tax=Mycena belliarum TaxID=1033014 RepID=A0AAD6XT54_9AGAR|nr:pheromone A receptor-domain-containing protein [Mycena belliae]